MKKMIENLPPPPARFSPSPSLHPTPTPILTNPALSFNFQYIPGGGSALGITCFRRTGLIS